MSNVKHTYDPMERQAPLGHEAGRDIDEKGPNSTLRRVSVGLAGVSLIGMGVAGGIQFAEYPRVIDTTIVNTDPGEGPRQVVSRGAVELQSRAGVEVSDDAISAAGGDALGSYRELTGETQLQPGAPIRVTIVNASIVPGYSLKAEAMPPNFPTPGQSAGESPTYDTPGAEMGLPPVKDTRIG